MADRKISQLSTLSSLASGDVFVVQDVSESGDAANKGITFGDLFGGATSTELSYLSGVTSNVQTQINSIESSYVPYSGASGNVDLGSYALTTTGNITAGNLNISNWDTAYSWGDHSTQGYLTDITGESLGDLSNVSTGTLSSGDLLEYDGSNFANVAKSSINLSSFNNDAGFITDYTVTNSDLTGLNISELNNDSGYITDITGESISSLSDVNTTGIADGNILKYNSTSGNWEVATESGGTDGDAIHDNVAGEINAITEKASLASADLLVIEDSESFYGKKSVQVGNLPTGSGADNTASNIGTNGVGVYDSKDGIDIRFRNIAPASTKLTVSLDATNNDIDIDVDETNIDHNNLTNYAIAEHRTINDTGTATTDLWSADKINTELGNKQDSDAGLTDIAGLAVTDGNFIVGNGTNWVAESGDTAIASLGLSTNLSNLTDAEVTQLENIGTVTITNTQWGYLGNMSAQPLEDLTGKTTDDLSEGSTNLYYTDTRVSNNTDVSANTTHRSSNGTDHSYIDQDVTTTANVEHKSVDFNSEYDNGTVSTNTDIDWTNGQNQKVTLGADVTFTFSNMGVGHKQIKIVQDATGSRTPTLPSGLWPGGSAGSFSTSANAVDILNIYYDGSSYYYQLTTGWA